ncbi:MAG: hypothetical protein R2730_09910 [Chitinophagales bacterium]
MTITSCNTETINEPSAEHIALEKADQQLTENLKMYESVWDDIINKREIDNKRTYFDTNITLITTPEM